MAAIDWDAAISALRAGQLPVCGGERRILQPLRAALTAPVLPPPPPTVREVTRWITSHPGHLSEEETAQLGQVKARSPRLNATAGHVTAFAEMMTGRHGERLPVWIDVGASFGYLACYLAHLAGPSGTVHAIRARVARITSTV